MSVIRVLYRFSFEAGKLEEMQAAWAAVVGAHQAAGHGAMESLFLVDREAYEANREGVTRALAISRWASFEAWQSERRDDVDEEAYGVFRAICEVVEKEVMVERGRMVGEFGEEVGARREWHSLEAIGRFFGVDEDRAMAILTLTEWVDAEEATEVHGYARDNRIPRPMWERLVDPGYRRRLRAAARDQAPELVGVLC